MFLLPTCAYGCGETSGSRPSSAGGPETAAPDAASVEVDLSAWFEGTDLGDATFVVMEGETGLVSRYNPARASQGFLPASTFKIPHALIALETGVAPGPDFTLEWDGRVPDDGSFWIEVWSQDHSLRSALQSSVVWYYREIARRIGPDRMQDYLDQFDYGNRTMGDPPDGFWLAGDLRISPDEQVEFLRRMDRGDLGVSDRSVGILKQMMVLEETEAYRLSGKTGSLSATPTRQLAWLVGYLERDGGTWYFALNLEGEEVGERWGTAPRRIELVKHLLEEVGALPPDSSR